MKTLLDTYKRLDLKNRVVMAPMTRSRATKNHIPTDIMATYYAQRASAGLIITEGTSPSPNGVGYARIPGIYTDEQAKAWKVVADEVHKNGGKIFMQLMHSGRLAHPENMPKGSRILAPSSIAPTHTKMYVDDKGMLEIPVPEEMTMEDINLEISNYVSASKRAIEVGFDGVELHGANGYLLDSFLSPHTNKRHDFYGGSIENRLRFPLAVVKKVSEAIGKDKVGIRISPNGTLGDMEPFDEQFETFSHFLEKLNELEIAYIHLLDLESFGQTAVPQNIRNMVREKFQGTLILSGGYSQNTGEEALKNNEGDLIAYGRPFIANPDLIDRWENESPLSEANPDFFYTPGEKGYTDYQTA
ncbi:alkene reductase [Winogradskyella sp.]|uniref:alkene reductase n=1 Tax=Winogradskyella sp. TaxID=1883156 RepID=UPI00260D471C|nr:alkene reductase [Winogradskyella sp.]